MPGTPQLPEAPPTLERLVTFDPFQTEVACAPGFCLAPAPALPEAADPSATFVPPPAPPSPPAQPLPEPLVQPAKQAVQEPVKGSAPGWTAAGPKKTRLMPVAALASYEAAKAALKQAALQKAAAQKAAAQPDAAKPSVQLASPPPAIQPAPEPAQVEQPEPTEEWEKATKVAKVQKHSLPQPASAPSES